MKIPLLKKAASLPKKVHTWVVPASPFNQLKCIWVILVLGGLVLWGVADWVTSNRLEQTVLLAAYTIPASGFCIYKIHQLTRQINQHYEKIKK